MLFKICHVQCAIVWMNVHPFDNCAAFFQRKPRRNICVVIETRDDDFVARVQMATKSARNVERERRRCSGRGRFRAKKCASKIGDAFACLRYDRVTVL
jgi:hypothetical protein